MPYVSRGEVLDKRSPWRLSIIPELFWGIINFVQLFFLTLINPGRTKHGSDYTTDYRTPGGPGGPGGPRRRIGRFGGGDAPSPPPMGGGG